MEEQFISLVRLINDKQINRIGDATVELLDTIFFSKMTTRYLNLLFKLIFHTYKYNPEPRLACTILSGFICFGRSKNGEVYKPLIDYIAIEAFYGLLKLGGWTILKPCVISLRESVQNYSNEPIFKHIVTTCVYKLKQDIKDIPYSSDLCYQLPREKSFSWGWFSYDIAWAYLYDSSPMKNKSGKEIRNCMMVYRKLLTILRKNITDMVSVVAEKRDAKNMEENWESILNELETDEYEWVSDIIFRTISDEEEEESMVVEPLEEVGVVGAETLKENGVVGAEPLTEPLKENGVVGAEPLTETLKENGVEEVTPLKENGVEEVTPLKENGVEEVTPLVEVGVVGAEPLTEPLTEPIKNTSWLYSLFGWS